ncbi:MAG: putative membrane protein, partial [Chitinophagales bacterium]
MTPKKYFLILSIIFLIQFLVLSISPYDRADWALENVLVIVFVIIMAISFN